MSGLLEGIQGGWLALVQGLDIQRAGAGLPDGLPRVVALRQAWAVCADTSVLLHDSGQTVPEEAQAAGAASVAGQ